MTEKSFQIRNYSFDQKAINNLAAEDRKEAVKNKHKKVIFEIKPPFNFRLEPEFSFSNPVGKPGGTRLLLRKSLPFLLVR